MDAASRLTHLTDTDWLANVLADGIHSEWVTERLAQLILIKGGADCWVWTGYVANNTYGLFRFGLPRLGHDPLGRYGAQAHRVVYEAAVGSIPPGLHLDHLCRNKLCVNPAHLEPVTAAENKRRDYEAQGVCRNGLHERSVENTYVDPRGGNHCRPCAKQIRIRKSRRLSLEEPSPNPSREATGGAWDGNGSSSEPVPPAAAAELPAGSLQLFATEAA